MILYPYNEILPTGRAHDNYVVHNAACLDATLAIGRGSIPDLQSHYGASPTTLHLPIIRKNNPLNLSWNLPFFHATQKLIKQREPQVVITSVWKQALYHHRRRLPKTKYIYEVHELPPTNELLDKADLIIVTTPALKRILQTKTPIEVVPLGVSANPLPPSTSDQFTIGFVGQLYEDQGVDLIQQSLPPDTHLLVVGGTPSDVQRHQQGPGQFLGFQPPQKLPDLLQKVDAFVMPSRNLEKKPHVAHTKLFEYASYGRPMILPDLPSVHEQLGPTEAIFYRAGDPQSLKAAIKKARGAKPPEPLDFSWEKRAERYRLVALF